MSNADESQDTERSDVRIRRAPKVATFLILGGGIGAIVTFILTAIFPVDPEVGFGALFGYFALFGVTAGVVVGALVAIILDRRADRNARTVTAVHEKTGAEFSEGYADEAFDAPADPVQNGAVVQGDVATPAPGTVPPERPERPSSPFFDQDDPPAAPRS